jgi:hypothetical protein
MKAKILTTVDIKQEWLDEIKEHIPAIVFDIERTTKPLQVYRNFYTNTNYAVWTHLRSLFDNGEYRYRVYVMSDSERLAYGMTDHLAAYNNVDRDGVLDFYMAVTERNLTKARRNGFRSNFARIFVHECLHGKEQEIGNEYLHPTKPDRTHDWEAEGRLKDLIKEHFTIKELKIKVGMLQTILELTKKLMSLK